jgi:hypothetical protein
MLKMRVSVMELGKFTAKTQTRAAGIQGNYPPQGDTTQWSFSERYSSPVSGLPVGFAWR